MIESEFDGNHQRTYTTDEVIAELVRTPEQRQRFLRTGWIHDIMFQLIHARVDAGLTQKELGERMGKQQSAIARLERADDIKLSTLFDYLAALDLTPASNIPVGSYTEAVRQIPGAAEDRADDALHREDRVTSDLAAD